jgi:hypothetical protein
VVEGSSEISQTTIFTPTKVGAYRYSAYIAAVGSSPSSEWTLTINYTDLTGIGVDIPIYGVVGNSSDTVGTVPFSAQQGTPVAFSLSAVNPGDSTYTFWFTIEQLQ